MKNRRFIRLSSMAVAGIFFLAGMVVYFNYFYVAPKLPKMSNLSSCRLILIGGAGEPNSKILYRIISATLHSDEFAYFQWYHEKEIAAFIEKFPREQMIILLGHSWGGSVATRIYRNNSLKIKWLITLDPVGWTTYSGKYCHNWINVVPVQKKISGNDLLAIAGNRWGKIEKAVNLTIQGDHNEIDTMLLARTEDKTTVWDLILSSLRPNQIGKNQKNSASSPEFVGELRFWKFAHKFW